MNRVLVEYLLSGGMLERLCTEAAADIEGV